VSGDRIAHLAITAVERVAEAAALLIVGYTLAVLARWLVGRLLRKREKALGPSFTQLLRASAYYWILAIGVGAALIALGVPATFVLAIGAAVLIVLAIALQESVADLAATVIFVVFRPFKRGELVKIRDHLGVVQEILLFNTVLLLPDQSLATLPNSKIQEEGIVNYSRIGTIRAEIRLLVPYEADLDRIRRVLTGVADDEDRVLDAPAPEISIDELADIGVRITFAPAVRPDDFLSASSALRLKVKEAFQAEGIEFAARIALSDRARPDGQLEP
jgi:small conductance mechanosensitive channel